MNDSDRKEWVQNAAPLYQWWKASRMGLSKFVKTYRETLDAYIKAQLEPREKESIP